MVAITPITYNRKINTRVMGTETENVSVLKAIIGQLGDGLWENNRSMRKYWMNAVIRVVGLHVYINVNDRQDYATSNSRHREVWYRNPYFTMNDKDIVKFFALKLKGIIRAQIRNARERGDLEPKAKEPPADFKMTYLALNGSVTYKRATDVLGKLMEVANAQ